MSPRVSEPLQPALLGALRAQLTPGERLAWAASPEPLAFARADEGADKWERATILGGGYVLLGSCVAAFVTGRWLWLAAPLCLIVLGVTGYFVARHLEVRAQRSLAGTVYGLTTRRALIVHTYPALKVQALPIEAITDVVSRDARDPFGDLCFSTAAAPAGFVFPGLAQPERAREQLLRVIRDPRAAEEEIAASEAYSMAMHQLTRSAFH